MAKPVIHVSEAEAAGDFAGLLAKVCSGAEVVIDRDDRPVAVVNAAEPTVRRLSDSLKIARERASSVTLDGGMEHDLMDAIDSHREPLKPPAWD